MVKKIISSKVFKNFTYLSVGTILSQIISLFTVIKITQFFSPENYGTYTFLIVQGTLILAIGDLGLRNIVIRNIARDPLKTKSLTFIGAVLRTIALVFFSLLYVLYNYAFGSLSSEQVLVVFLFALISCFSKLLEAAYLGNQRMFPTALINLIFSIIWFLVIYFLPLSYFSVNFLLWIFLLISIVKCCIYYLSLKYHKLLQGEVENFRTSSISLLKQSWPYFLLVLVMLPFTHFSNNFLDVNSSTAEIGYFNLSERLIGPVSIVLDLALVSIFPNLSALWSKNEYQFKYIISTNFQYFLLLAGLLCFLFTLFSSEFFSFFFKASYLPALIVCQLQIWYLFLTSVDSFIGTVLGATNKEKLILKLGILRSCFSIPILYFGSTFGALGLSYGYVIAFAIFQIYLWYAFEKASDIKIENRGWIWLLSISLFSISQLIPAGFPIVNKAILSLLIVCGITYYIFKTYKLKINI